MPRTLILFSFLAVTILFTQCSKSTKESTSPASQSAPTTGANPSESNYKASADIEYGVPFLWPPPKPSAQTLIPRRLLIKYDCATKIRDIADHLEDALEKAGYERLAWFSVPHGFAVSTRLEQINPNGTPLKPPDRWSEAYPRNEFSIADYLKSLVTARVGHYRVIVFILTDIAAEVSARTPKKDEVEDWLRRGDNQLPKAIGRMEFSSTHYCLALIYEFEKTDKHDPVFMDPSGLSANTHLEKSFVLSALEAVK